MMNQRFNVRVQMLCAVLAISGLTALAGCYTVLKHPPTAEVADGGEGQRDCYSCHGPGGGALAYDPLHTPGYDYYSDNWYGFYAYPWWWRDYWQDDIYAHGSTVGSGGQPKLWDDDDESRRRLWGRGSEFLPPSLPPIYGAPTSDLPRGVPTSSQPPPPSGGKEEGRTAKDGARTAPPTPVAPPAPPQSPPPTSERKAKDAESKPPPQKKDQDQKKDDGGGS